MGWIQMILWVEVLINSWLCMPLLLVEQLRDIQIYVQILRGKFSIIDCMLGKLCLYTIKLHNLHLETIVDLYIYKY